MAATPLFLSTTTLISSVCITAGGGEVVGGANIKTEAGVVSPQNSVLAKAAKHINNVSVIQCGPALANAAQVKVKCEPGGLPPPTPPPAEPTALHPQGTPPEKALPKPGNEEVQAVAGQKELEGRLKLQAEEPLSQLPGNPRDTSKQEKKPDFWLANVAPEKEKEASNHTQDAKSKGADAAYTTP